MRRSAPELSRVAWAVPLLVAHVPLHLGLGLWFIGCTPAERQEAKTVIAVAEPACAAGLSSFAAAPELAPICVGAAEIADAILDILAERTAAATTEPGRMAAKQRPTDPEIHRRIVKRRAERGGAK
jgi:zona occludens toxin (predicted ATPase)